MTIRVVYVSIYYNNIFINNRIRSEYSVMAFCQKCGTQLAETANFCPVCGTSVNNNETSQPSQPQQQIHDTSNDKLMAILSYIGILVLIPIFVTPRSDYVKFHANQGLVLLIFEAATAILSSILAAMFAVFSPMAIVVPVIAWLLEMGYLGLAIYGIVNAAQMKTNELPIIGKIKIIK